MNYKSKILKQAEGMLYEEIMSELSRNIKSITKGWDTVISQNGRYYLYDYERKHSYDEEYGREIKGEELNKYLALKELYDDFLYGRRETDEKSREIMI